MKKFLTAIIAVLLVALLAATVSGCSKSATVKAAFKNADYQITSVSAEDCDELVSLLKTDELKETIGKYKVFTCAKAERSATIIKFPSEKVMKEVLGETTYDTKLKNGYINGDCYMVAGCTDALYIFKNA